MLGISMTYQGPDLSRSATNKELKAALDKAFANHQVKFLPIHFTEQAYARYPAAYAYAQARVAKQTGQHIGAKQRIEQNMASMTAAERKEYRRGMRQEKARKRLREQAQGLSRKRTADWRLPLVHTGRMREATLNQQPQFTGRVDTRKMKLNEPFYLNVSKANGAGMKFEKAAALKAVTDEESREFARVVDDELQKYLGG